MTVVRVWTAGKDIDLAGMSRLPEGEDDLRRVLEVAALATQDAASGGPDAGGDPVDKALVEAAARFGIDRARLLELQRPAGIVPFSSERKLMASFHRKERGTSVRAPSRGWGPVPLNMDGKLVAYVKGAPQQVVELAGYGPSGEALDDRGRQTLLAANDNLARAGLRVLGLASGPVEQPVEAALKGLRFVGLVGLIDPPAPGVKETIARLRAAGLRTVMLTGDQRLTAEAIGRELGVLEDDVQVISGNELDALSREELEARVTKIGVFSRITPEHKLAIVSALQARGEIVAMLGDGVNDAPALKKADVGVAMGKRGTDVAKEAASIVLQDDRFETIAAAVEEGRVIFDNIRKFVFYLFSCNLAEVLTLLVVGLIGLPIPLLPLQILWLNMVTDTFPALALAMEPGDPDVMNRPPRNPQEAILSRRFLTNILVYASLITACVLGAFLWAHEEMPERAVTVTFMTLALAQIFHLVNARAGSVMSLAWFVGNRYAVGAIVLSVGLQFAAMYVEPLARTLRVVPLGPQQWAVVLAVSALPAIVGQGLRIARATGSAAAG
jgi:Ca2+-transporting ATPase